MSTTPKLGLPLIAAAQAQKHVTHNEALYALDALVQCAVLDRDLSTPPSSPPEGAVYIVGPAPTGEWAGKAGRIALLQDGLWLAITPRIGFVVYVIDEALLYVFTSAGWTALTSALTAIQSLAILGIGTVADATNPFSAKLNKALWTARGTAEGGTGDLRYTLNKQATANALSLLFQTGYSGRCELGLIGSDNFVAKVSSDGTNWLEAASLDAATGSMDFLSAEATLASAATVDLGSVKARRILVTGTTTIGSFGTSPNRERILRFSGAATLTHSANLSLPGGANVTTLPGDCAIATSDASGNWRLFLHRNIGPSDQSVASVASVVFANLRAKMPTTGGSVSLVAGDSNSGYLDWRRGDGTRLAYMGYSSDGLPLYLGSGGFSVANASHTLLVVDAGVVRPGVDNTISSGTSSARWSTVYAGTGSINTSDARDKTAVSPMTVSEIAAARDLAAEIGTFQFLDAVATKGAEHARRHVGLTVQRAIEIMAARGLEPLRYAFICHDAWQAESAEPEVRDETGNVMRAATPGRPAGDLYSLRPDELVLFIARGQEARLAALEAAA